MQAYALAGKLSHDLQRVPGVVDAHVFQVTTRRRSTSTSTVR